MKKILTIIILINSSLFSYDLVLGRDYEVGNSFPECEKYKEDFQQYLYCSRIVEICIGNVSYNKNFSECKEKQKLTTTQMTTKYILERQKELNQ